MIVVSLLVVILIFIVTFSFGIIILVIPHPITTSTLRIAPLRHACTAHVLRAREANLHVLAMSRIRAMILFSSVTARRLDATRRSVGCEGSSTFCEVASVVLHQKQLDRGAGCERKQRKLESGASQAGRPPGTSDARYSNSRAGGSLLRSSSLQ